MAVQLPFIFILFFANFLILFGPLLLLGAGQIKGYEPGDADWGVKLADVRGQAEAKEEITRVVSLWQSGEAFEKAGGKRERGVLFLGAPGHRQDDALQGHRDLVQLPVRLDPGLRLRPDVHRHGRGARALPRAEGQALARKWGGQCIVFIDEIDAVGMRRQALGSGYQPSRPHDPRPAVLRPDGALTSDGDLVLETAAWRDRLFACAPSRAAGLPAGDREARGRDPALHDAGHDGRRRRAGAQPAAGRDGRHRRPAADEAHPHQGASTRSSTRLYIVPRRIGKLKLRLPPPRPNKEEIYFIGACNVVARGARPALTRPGRMGRHIYFRTPTWEDRRDIFDLYLEKVAHDPSSTSPSAATSSPASPTATRRR
jgi:SpoVK/Ycf46/Vps4 family AAA+-type ATPase